MAARGKTKKAEATEIVATRLRQLLDYDPATGEFRWRQDRPRCREGQIAGHAHCQGYRGIRVDGRAYLAHRLAWLYVHGAWPKDQIDHINGNRADNRIANLRECTNALNCQNVRAHRDSTSKYPGVSLADHARGKPWLATICVAGKKKYLGHHETEELAFSAYRLAKRELHQLAGKENA